MRTDSVHTMSVFFWAGRIYSGITDGAGQHGAKRLWNGLLVGGIGTNNYGFDVTLLNSEAFSRFPILVCPAMPISGSTLFGLQVTRATDVPEPFTLSLFGAGVAGLTAMRRRQKKAA